MTQIRMSVVHKGLLLSLLPLLLQFVLIANLSFLLRQADQDNRLELEKVKVIEAEHTLLEDVLKCESALEGICSASDSLALARYKTQSNLLRAFLNAPSANDEFSMSQRGNLSGQKELALSLLKQFDSTMLSSDAAAKTVSRQSNFGGVKISAQLQNSISDFETQIHKYLQEMEQQRSNLQKAQIRSRKQLNIFIFTAVAIDLVLAVILSSGFLLGISRRLTVLNDNIQLYTSGKELWAPLSGTDELSGLDRMFHQMARSLKATRDELQASETRLQLLIQMLPVGLLILNDDGRVESVNDTLCESLGCAAAALVGKSIASFLPGVDCQRFYSGEEENGGIKPIGGTIGSFEAVACKHSGAVMPVELTFKRLTMPEGSRILLAVQDISERLETEKLKQEFLSMVTHDLRTPLTSIHLFHQLLRKNAFGLLPESVQQPLSSAEMSTSRLLSLVGELLDYERLEAGKMQLRIAPTLLSSILERAVESVHPFANERGLKISKPSVDLELEVDEQRMVQVMVNLLSNAIKFTKAGSQIEIQTKLDKITGYLEISVIDQGKGLSKIQQLAIFERFVTHSDGSDVQQGSGLGLAICKGIVEEHGGEIGVESELNEGARFWFRIPINGD